MTNNNESRSPSDRPSISPAGAATGPQITLRSPAELADALPYMLGFHPSDSLVLVAVHGEGGRFGGRLRVGIPTAPAEWEDTARQVADCLIRGSERRGGKPDGIVVYLCQEPREEESGQRVMTRLRPLAQRIRLACGALDVPVLEALCLSEGRFWSYVCPDERCCPAEGTRLAAVGTSVMAATATFAGLQVRGSLKEIEGRLAPLRGAVAAEAERALDRAAAALMPRILDGATREEVGAETISLAQALMRRMTLAPPVEGGSHADDWDDALLGHDEAASLILGLQDREIRDIAAEWMEDEEAAPALRLWRALARRCVGAYGEHAAAPSPSQAGSPGPPGTSRPPGSPSAWPCGRTPNTASPSCSTTRATRGSTPRVCGSACGRSAAAASPGGAAPRRAPVLPGGGGGRRPAAGPAAPRGASSEGAPALEPWSGTAAPERPGPDPEAQTPAPASAAGARDRHTVGARDPDGSGARYPGGAGDRDPGGGGGVQVWGGGGPATPPPS